MNKAISQEVIQRMQRCIVDMGNKMNCYESTGIHYSTIEKIIERGYAKEKQIEQLVSYCDEVEGLTVANQRD